MTKKSNKRKALASNRLKPANKITKNSDEEELKTLKIENTELKKQIEILLEKTKHLESKETVGDKTNLEVANNNINTNNRFSILDQTDDMCNIDEIEMTDSQTKTNMTNITINLTRANIRSQQLNTVKPRTVNNTNINVNNTVNKTRGENELKPPIIILNQDPKYINNYIKDQIYKDVRFLY